MQSFRTYLSHILLRALHPNSAHRHKADAAEMEWTEADKAELIHPGYMLPYQPLATQVFEKTCGLSADEHRCGAPSAESRNIATLPNSVKWHC